MKKVKINGRAFKVTRTMKSPFLPNQLVICTEKAYAISEDDGSPEHFLILNSDSMQPIENALITFEILEI